jgi:hypothetical protein
MEQQFHKLRKRFVLVFVAVDFQFRHELGLDCAIFQFLDLDDVSVEISSEIVADKVEFD